MTLDRVPCINKMKWNMTRCLWKKNDRPSVFLIIWRENLRSGEKYRHVHTHSHTHWKFKVLLQDKTLMHRAYTEHAHTWRTCTYPDSLKTHTLLHTFSASSNSARKSILCFWCPSVLRDLLSLSEEPLLQLHFPGILRFQEYSHTEEK